MSDLPFAGLTSKRKLPWRNVMLYRYDGRLLTAREVIDTFGVSFTNRLVLAAMMEIAADRFVTGIEHAMFMGDSHSGIL